MWEKQLCRHQGQWKSRGRRSSRHCSRDSPADCGKDHGEAGCPTAAHRGPQWRRYPRAAHGRPHTRAGRCPKEAVTPWRAHAGVGSCQDLWTHRDRSPHYNRFAGRTCGATGDPCWSSLFLKDCTPCEGPTLGQFVKSCTLWEGPTLEKFVENCLLICHY